MVPCGTTEKTLTERYYDNVTKGPFLIQFQSGVRETNGHIGRFIFLFKSSEALRSKELLFSNIKLKAAGLDDKVLGKVLRSSSYEKDDSRAKVDV